MSAIDAVIFDLETLRDSAHRQPMLKVPGRPDFVAFCEASKDDKPLPHMIDLVRTLIDAELDEALDVIFFSGLPEKFRPVTSEWLTSFVGDGGAYRDVTSFSEKLFMRPNGNFKHDLVVKPLVVEAIREAGFRPIMIFEQRASLAKMWRAAGIPAWSQDADY